MCSLRYPLLLGIDLPNVVVTIALRIDAVARQLRLAIEANKFILDGMELALQRTISRQLFLSIEIVFINEKLQREQIPK